MRAAYDVLMDLELRGVYDKVRMTLWRLWRPYLL